jgi:hypothetical protein
MEQKGVTGGAVPADPVSAIFGAIQSGFELIQAALAPGIISAQAYFQQLLNAQPVFQDPFANVNENRRATDTLLIYVGAAIIVLLLLVILFKKRK